MTVVLRYHRLRSMPAMILGGTFAVASAVQFIVELMLRNC